VSGTDAPRRRGRRRRAALAGGAALVVAAGAAAAVGLGGGDEQPAGRSDLPPATAPVTRGTLVQTESVSGTLGYGDEHTLSARGSGTVTWLPATGSVLRRGAPAYRVDDRPVLVLYGVLPLYRPLGPGDRGADVRLLEQNLYALGYRGFTVDDRYTASTASRVRDWQDTHGRTKTGTVQQGDVAVVPGPVRVRAVLRSTGDPASGPVETWTSTIRTVSVDLDVAQQELVRPGIAATVKLPDGRAVDGRVTSVGTVATEHSSGSGADAQTTTTISVRVAVPDQQALGSLDAAPVTVVLQSDKRADVLTVPVAALLALAEGGYGVQVVTGSTTRIVAVTTGMFADGRVEVSGSGLAEGLTVGIPK
jgi:peptidoglycan hydrolase-like protein with peptidoglycan-binding domain